MNKALLKRNLRQSTNTSSDLTLTHFLVSPMNVLCDLIWLRIDLDIDGDKLGFKARRCAECGNRRHCVPALMN